MKKFVWPLIVIFFLLGGLTAVLVGLFVLPPEPRTESVEAISEKWTDSAHADMNATAFTYWDGNDPPEIPASCAKCHSTYGYLDYLGEDESKPNIGTRVDESAQTGSVVSCLVCHNNSAHVKEVAYFPSGESIGDLDTSVNCAECHQGRRSSATVSDAVMGIPEDEINEDLGFINVHYKIAAAVRYGSDVKSGYEFPGKTYVGFYEHTDDYQLCADCHDPHSLLLTPDECAACHSAVSNYGDFRDVRSNDTPDYDGDGDTVEGVYGEITTIHDQLYIAIQSYATEILDLPILYTEDSPFWYIDLNGNGVGDEDEINSNNQYPRWTPRLVKATYNYHFVLQDPGGFMHNAEYLIQLMYDTLEDLSSVVDVNMKDLIRPE